MKNWSRSFIVGGTTFFFISLIKPFIFRDISLVEGVASAVFSLSILMIGLILEDFEKKNSLTDNNLDLGIKKLTKLK